MWAEQWLAERAGQHGAAIKSWLAIADAAPALGMAGTIIGLIRMFAAMDDPSAIGGAMAIALLTTLYGVVLANMIAGPIAARLTLLSEMEIGWQRSEERRVGKEWVSTCKSRWSPYHRKKTTQYQIITT